MATRMKTALLDRLEIALRDMYHNATPNHPAVDSNQIYESWFSDVCRQELEYLTGGLGLTQKDWKRQEKLGFIASERKFWLIQRITEFGKLYTWGRGGRTLAPDNLIRRKGGSSFAIIDADDYSGQSNGELTDMIQIIEAFNQYVEDWNKGIPEMWEEELLYRLEEEATC